MNRILWTMLAFLMMAGIFFLMPIEIYKSIWITNIFYAGYASLFSLSLLSRASEPKPVELIVRKK